MGKNKLTENNYDNKVITEIKSYLNLTIKSNKSHCNYQLTKKVMTYCTSITVAQQDVYYS